MKHLHNFDTVAEYEAVKGTLEMPYIVSIDETDGLQYNTEVIRVPQGSAGSGGGSETMYFAAKDGGAMGYVSEMSLMGGFAVKKADNTISSIGTFLLADDFSEEALMSVKAIAFALGNYSSGGGADISDPDMLRRLMFHFNGAEEMPKIIEITKEQFYSVE